MQDFLLKEIFNADMAKELSDIGFDKSYIHSGKNKFLYKNFKIYNLSVAQANILKQTAISVGADCATNRNVITGKAELSDCILGGSISQLKKISDKIKFQPFGLKLLAERIEAELFFSEANKTKIVGVLNITPDSFSDGGKYFEFDKAVEHFNQLVTEGADIIDIGAESTKPYSKEVDAKTQIARLEPILEYIQQKKINIPISIDTRSAEVAKRAIELGASIINDVSGLDYDADMAEVIARNQVKVVIQHSNGNPQNMQDNPVYESLIDDIYKSLKQKVDFAIARGIKKENIILDPGIGFGKTREDNLEIIRRWKEFRTMGCPVMLGLSRKSFLGSAQDFEKDIYTLAFNSLLISENIDYLRVHDVKLHRGFISLLN